MGEWGLEEDVAIESGPTWCLRPLLTEVQQQLQEGEEVVEVEVEVQLQREAQGVGLLGLSAWEHWWIVHQLVGQHPSKMRGLSWR